MKFDHTTALFGKHNYLIHIHILCIVYSHIQTTCIMIKKSNLSIYGDAFIRHWTRSPFVHIIGCCLFGTETLSGQITVDRIFENKVHWIFNRETMISMHENDFEIAISKKGPILSWHQCVKYVWVMVPFFPIAWNLVAYWRYKYHHRDWSTMPDWSSLLHNITPKDRWFKQLQLKTMHLKMPSVKWLQFCQTPLIIYGHFCEQAIFKTKADLQYHNQNCPGCYLNQKHLAELSSVTWWIFWSVKGTLNSLATAAIILKVRLLGQSLWKCSP